MNDIEENELLLENFFKEELLELKEEIRLLKKNQSDMWEMLVALSPRTDRANKEVD